MANTTKELNCKCYLILINLNLKLILDLVIRKLLKYV